METIKINITSYEMHEEPELLKRNGNPADEYTVRLISGDFILGETVTVETIKDGKKYTRKVRDDSWDLYVMIGNNKRYWECDFID